MFGIFTGDYKIDGGADSDIYDAFFVDVLVASVDDTGTGLSNKFFSFTQGAADSYTGVETFIAGEAIDESDAIFLTTDVLSSDIDTAISGLDDTAAGLFTDTAGNATAFGPLEGYALSDILAGTSPDGILPAVGPFGSFRIVDGDEDGQIGNIAFENFEEIQFTVAANPDGVVDGLDTGQTMGLRFTDIDGDQTTTGADSILGNGGSDTIDADAGDDTIDSGAGQDLIIGGAGADSIDGGESDFDEITYANSAEGVNVSLTTGVGSGGDADGETLTGIERVIGSDFGDTLQGNAAANLLNAGEGDDLIISDDNFFNDTVIGGEGDDTLSFEQRAFRIEVRLDENGNGNASDGTSFGGFENVFGGDGRDELIGNSSANELRGGDGRDSIFGFTGADSIFGEEGSDFIVSNAEVAPENVLYDGGAGEDILELEALSGSGGAFQFGDYRSIEFNSLERLFLDTQGISGKSGGQFTAKQFADNFEGVFIFGDGDVTLEVTMGDETALDLSGVFANSTDSGLRTFEVIGDDDAETIAGGNLRASIFGNGGNDTILSGLCADSLSGGDDDDVFRAAATSVLDPGGTSFDPRTSLFGDTVDGGDGGTDLDTLDLSGLGPFRIVNETTDADGNSTSGSIELLDGSGGVDGTLTFREIERIICFTPGAAVMTRHGPVPIEDLRAGHSVMTRDNGFQEVAWIGQRSLSAGDLQMSPKLLPILIRRGALGPDLPDRDMMVSPNHRMLQVGPQVELHFGETEVLMAAKHMTHLPGIEQVNPGATRYIHMMFENHQIVMANGCWTESLFPGDEAIDAATAAQRDEIFHLFPDLRARVGRGRIEMARPVPKRFEATLI